MKLFGYHLPLKSVSPILLDSFKNNLKGVIVLFVF